MQQDSSVSGPTLVERLRAGIPNAAEGTALFVIDEPRLDALLTEAAAEIERLRAALEPFAKVPDFWESDDQPVVTIDFGEMGDEIFVIANDFRRARAALKDPTREQ